MRNVRLIAKLDVKGANLVKTIQLEGLRKLGYPDDFACKYYESGIDEIFYYDVVASLYERNNIFEIVKKTSQNVFVPITVGGGLRNINDVETALKSGADKVSLNSEAIKNPSIIGEIARNFGSQCLVINIQSKKIGNNYEAYYYSGRERSYLNSIEWAKKCQDLGAGEIILTSIDNEGMGNGFDLQLISQIMNNIEIPVIISGGLGNLRHLDDLFNNCEPDGICMSHVLHYEKHSIKNLRDKLFKLNIPTRY